MIGRKRRGSALTIGFPQHASCQLALFVTQCITAYFDESETQSVGVKPLLRESRAVVIAGFLATAEQWEQLEDDWNRIFEQHKLPTDAVFHMNEFTSSLGVFGIFRGKEWERRRFLSQLIGLLEIRLQRSIARSLRVKDYDELDAKLSLRENASPYTFCALAAIEAGSFSAHCHNWDFGILPPVVLNLVRPSTATVFRL